MLILLDYVKKNIYSYQYICSNMLHSLFFKLSSRLPVHLQDLVLCCPPCQIQTDQSHEPQMKSSCLQVLTFNLRCLMLPNTKCSTYSKMLWFENHYVDKIITFCPNKNLSILTVTICTKLGLGLMHIRTPSFLFLICYKA